MKFPYTALKQRRLSISACLPGWAQRMFCAYCHPAAAWCECSKCLGYVDRLVEGGTSISRSAVHGVHCC